jgi:hypothetical protein
MDKFARKIKLVPIKNSTTFSIADPQSSDHRKSSASYTSTNDNNIDTTSEHFIELGKVAPGMEVPFTIVFRPDTTSDYQTHIIAVTERERFLIPINAVGARPCLTLPDNLTFIDAPVKGKKTELLLVKNVGNADAVFTSSIDRPFSIIPADGIIPPRQQAQFQISYEPQVKQYFSQDS